MADDVAGAEPPLVLLGPDEAVVLAVAVVEDVPVELPVELVADPFQVIF